MSVLGVVLILSLLAEAPPEPQVPLGIQLPAMLKALSYDRALAADEPSMRVIVVFDPKDTASTESRDRIFEIQGRLTRLRVKGRPVVFEAVPYTKLDELPAAPVVLVTALDPELVEDISIRARESGTLTLAATPEDVVLGLVLGMESLNGKPRFVVNLAAAKAAGVSFDSNFLALCRVVER